MNYISDFFVFYFQFYLLLSIFAILLFQNKPGNL